MLSTRTLVLVCRVRLLGNCTSKLANYAFRKARQHGFKASCWGHGAHLAGQVSQWTKSLDQQLACLQAAEEPKFADKSRVLVAHVSDAITVPQDDEVASCATTEAWESVSHSGRKPRHRPRRRARRTEKVLEEDRLMRSLAGEGAKELEWETRGLSAGLLMTCFEDCCDDEFGAMDDACVWEEFALLVQSDRDHSHDQEHTRATISRSSQTDVHKHGLKRKLVDVDVKVLDRDE